MDLSRWWIPEAGPCVPRAPQTESSVPLLLRAQLPYPVLSEVPMDMVAPDFPNNRRWHVDTEKDWALVFKLTFHEQNPFFPPLLKKLHVGTEASFQGLFFFCPRFLT